MKFQMVIIALLIFLFGWFSNTLYSNISYTIIKIPSLLNANPDRMLDINHENIENNEVANADRMKDKNATAEIGMRELTAGIAFKEPQSKPSPFDWIKENQIYVLRDKVILNIKNAEWATFTPTHSMEPVLDETTNAIQIVPESEEDIHIGDIISFTSDYSDGTIIHRVVKIGYDNDGWYCITKGDNINSLDPGKVRFEQIKRVVVAIIY